MGHTRSPHPPSTPLNRVMRLLRAIGRRGGKQAQGDGRQVPLEQLALDDRVRTVGEW